MSLINDALKQTKQIQQPKPSSGPPPLPPAESTSGGNLGWLVPGIVILLFVIAGIFIGLSLFKHKPVSLTASAMPTQKVKLTATAPLPTTNAASSTNSVAAAPPKPPELKLQGILLSAIRPCAIVSGKTVFVGDRINDFRVVAIARDNITLQSETETKVLSLNPQ